LLDLDRQMTRSPDRQMKLVVFDLDGTLVDSLQDLAESANDLLSECGAPRLPQETVGLLVGDGAATLVAKTFAVAGIPQPPDALVRFLELYNARLLRFTKPYPGIPDVLDMLSRRVTLAVLTNKPLAATRAILDGLNLSRFFSHDLVVGGDGPFPRKPDPAGLLHLVATVNVTPDQTLLVGDSVFDWRTAAAARTRGALARYGFGFRGVALEELDGSALLLDRPLDVLNAL
jgi:phosphoglycolate phosphatase